MHLNGASLQLNDRIKNYVVGFVLLLFWNFPGIKEIDLFLTHTEGWVGIQLTESSEKS